MKKPIIIGIVVIVLIAVVVAVIFWNKNAYAPSVNTNTPAPTPEATNPTPTMPTNNPMPNQTGTPAPQTTTTPPPAPNPASVPASSVEVLIKNFAFNPSALNISAGQKVIWTNNDSAPHQIKADNNSFSSGVLSNGDTYEFTFSTPGTYSYHCTIHPSMTAQIIVK